MYRYGVVIFVIVSVCEHMLRLRTNVHRKQSRGNKNWNRKEVRGNKKKKYKETKKKKTTSHNRIQCCPFFC